MSVQVSKLESSRRTDISAEKRVNWVELKRLEVGNFIMMQNEICDEKKCHRCNQFHVNEKFIRWLESERNVREN